MTKLITTNSNNATRIERFDPPGVAPIPGIHHVVVVPPATTVHVGGQVAFDENGEFPAGGLADQVRVAARNLRTCLQAAGADVADLVRVRVFLVDADADRVAEFEEAILTELPDWPAPTATLIGVDALFVPEALIEIDAEAAIVRD